MEVKAMTARKSFPIMVSADLEKRFSFIINVIVFLLHADSVNFEVTDGLTPRKKFKIVNERIALRRSKRNKINDAVPRSLKTSSDNLMKPKSKTVRKKKLMGSCCSCDLMTHNKCANCSRFMCFNAKCAYVDENKNVRSKDLSIYVCYSCHAESQVYAKKNGMKMNCVTINLYLLFFI